MTAATYDLMTPLLFNWQFVSNKMQAQKMYLVKKLPKSTTQNGHKRCLQMSC